MLWMVMQVSGSAWVSVTRVSAVLPCAVGLPTPPVIDGVRTHLVASNKAGTGALSTKNQRRLRKNTQHNKQMHQVQGAHVPVSFVSLCHGVLFERTARITHCSRRCMDRSSTNPSFVNARSKKKKTGGDASARASDLGCALRRAWCRTTTCFLPDEARCVRCNIKKVHWHEQTHGRQAQRSTTHTAKVVIQPP